MNHTSGGLSRREFLYRAAALGGTGLLLRTLNAWGADIGSRADGPPMLQGSGRGKTIIILGAGLAGMTAAYELGKLGYDCRILEARSFAGGRCQSARRGTTIREFGGESQTCDFDEGLYINHGPWRIPYHHRSTLHYTKLFGVTLEIMVNDNDTSYVYYEGQGPLANRRLRQVEVKADMRGYVAELLAKAVKDNRLDAELTADDKNLLLDYLVHEGDLSRTDLQYRGNPGRGFKVNPGAGIDPGPGIPSDPLGFHDLLGSKLGKVYSAVQEFDQQATMFQPVGGMDRIAKAFEKEVGRNIRYEAVVRAIRQRDGGDGVTVEYRDASGTTGGIDGAFCLCTIPLAILGGIENNFSPKFKQAIKSVAYAPVGKIGLQMKRRFWEEDDFIYGGHVHTNARAIGTISLPSTGWQSQKGVVLGYYQFGGEAAEISALSPKERMDFALAAGQKIFPIYRNACETAFSVAWHRVPYSLGGWAEWSPAARKETYPLLWEGEGRVLLAGEHMSYLPGWQAGAIESSWQQIARIHQMLSA